MTRTGDHTSIGVTRVPEPTASLAVTYVGTSDYRCRVSRVNNRAMRCGPISIVSEVTTAEQA